MEQLPRAVGRPGVPELRERLDSALRHWVWTLGGPAWSQQMDSGIFSAHLNPLDSRFIFSRFVCPHTNEETYLVLTEMNFLDLHQFIRNAAERKSQNAKLRKKREAGAFLSGKRESPAKFPPLWFPAPVECKTNKYWSEKRGESTYFM